MAKIKVREEVISSFLAKIVSGFDEVANTETILSRAQHRPDVLFQLRGLRVIIESKIGDSQSAAEIALNDAMERVLTNIAHIAVAIVYPRSLAHTATSKIRSKLKKTKLKYCVISENSTSTEWTTGTPAEMMESICLAQELLVKNVLVEKTASRLSNHLEKIATLWKENTDTCENLAELLGMNATNNEDEATKVDRLESAAKISALVLANAYIFQEQLAGSDRRVRTLSKLRTEKLLFRATSDHWCKICKKINNDSIFQLSRSILLELPAQVGTDKLLLSLIDEALSICSESVALRHDLMGRIYHWIFHDATNLGSYYSSQSTATLLLKIAMSMDWNTDFSNIREISDFVVADFTNSLGTLLMAANQEITDKFVKSCYKQRIALDSSKSVIPKSELKNLHQTLLENTLHGYDFHPLANHLTASSLALIAPDVVYRRMNLYSIPTSLGLEIAKLSDLNSVQIEKKDLKLSFDNLYQNTNLKRINKFTPTNITAPKVDLCVMAPPFKISGGNNKIFGLHGDDYSKKLKGLSTRAKKVNVNTTPGLSAVFVSLADQYLKPGGRIAFVLPLAIATGDSWGKVPQLISEKYHLEMVISSHESNRTNFSKNTDFSEILFIARKLKENETAGNTSYISLRRNPDSVHDARDFAEQITTALKKCNETQQPATIESSTGVLGEISSMPTPGIYNDKFLDL